MFFAANYTGAVQPSQSIFAFLESSDSFILLPSLNAVVMSQVSREGTERGLGLRPVLCL